MLLQQRSRHKITFPLSWTNACCSHPAHIEEELDTSDEFIGMRRAALRRSAFELGISTLEPKDVRVVSRILYYAPSCERWGEYELDYILIG